jgi:hypothetical protein
VRRVHGVRPFPPACGPGAARPARLSTGDSHRASARTFPRPVRGWPRASRKRGSPAFAAGRSSFIRRTARSTPNRSLLRTLSLPNGIVVEYAYEDASQVTGLTYKLGGTTLGTLTYAYDLAGRRTSLDGTWARTGLPQAMLGATYDAANRLRQWADSSFTYDASGNLTSDGLTSFGWDARNHQ